MSLHDDPTPGDPRDDVAALIRLAGRRPAVPEDVAARVRAAAHEHWRGELRQRARTRFRWTAAALATAAAVVLAVGWSVFRPETRPAVPRIAGRIESLAGAAWVRGARDPRSRPLRLGAEVVTGSAVETGGGRVAVRLASGHSVRLDAGSRLRFVDRATLVLDGGAVYVDSGTQVPRAAPLDVRTPQGDVRELGTQFEVRLGTESIRIRVREGSVMLRDAAGLHVVRAATELESDGRGAPRMRKIAPSGPEWSWITRVTPMPDLEGLPARAFLDWAAREGGWTLRFTDQETARLAAETTLSGSLEGLTPEQALAAVLPTCGLEHRIEDGRLTVRRAAG